MIAGDLAEVEDRKGYAGRHGYQAEQLIDAAQLIGQPGHSVAEPVQDADDLVEGRHHEAADTVGDAERFIRLGQP